MTELVSRAQGVRFDELALATRNHGMQLESMRYDIRPIGIHYLLIHFDIPEIDTSSWRLRVTGYVKAWTGVIARRHQITTGEDNSGHSRMRR